MKKDTRSPGAGTPPPSAREAREARLAAALRANLRRRKAASDSDSPRRQEEPGRPAEPGAGDPECG